MTARPLRSLYQLKITLKSIRPPIWRRFLIASTTNLKDVHLALQIIMGWENKHLHDFTIDYDQYGELDEEFFNTMKDESKFRLDQLLKKEKDRLTYHYDYGDGWEHDVLLEKILPFNHDVTLPQCIKGKRACPPEDVGGPPGYTLFLDTVNDESNPGYDAICSWLGSDFDAEYFNIHDINTLLLQHIKR